MNQEQWEGVVPLGTNVEGFDINTQLINNPKRMKSKAKEFNNRMSPKRLRQLNENLKNKQKEAIKETSFGGLHIDMIQES